jgi:hypothetical protein
MLYQTVNFILQHIIFDLLLIIILNYPNRISYDYKDIYMKIKFKKRRLFCFLKYTLLFFKLFVFFMGLYLVIYLFK